MRLTAPALAVSAALGFGCADHNGAVATPPDVVNTLSDIRFEAQMEVFTGLSQVSDSVMADVTGDGVPDIAVIDLIGAVRVLVGQPGGVFVPGGTYTVAADSSQVEASDLDLDGDLDLVVVSFRESRIDVLLNDGFGDFAATTSVTTSPVPSSFVVADCNDDTIPDLVVSHYSPSFVGVYLGLGGGGFGGEMTLPVPFAGNTSGLVVAEVTGDGHTDILVCDTDHDQVLVYVGDALGRHDQIVAIATGDAPFDCAVGDLTGDGIAELAVTNFNDRSVQVFAPVGGNSAFALLQEFVVDGLPSYGTIADVTGDGMNDLVLSLVDTRAVAIYEGLSTASPRAPLGAETRLGTTGAPLRPQAGDVNGDGRPDLMVSGIGSSTINMFLGRAMGLAGARHLDTPVSSPATIDSADFDGNGSDEIVVGGLGQELVSFMLPGAKTDGTNDPTMQELLSVSVADTISAPMPRTVYDVLATDIDADGDPDVLVAVDGGFKVCRNTSPAGGPLSFDVEPAVGTYGTGTVPYEVAVGDVTGDGILDVIVGYATEDLIDVVPGLGDGQFGTAFSNTVPGGSGGLAVADFDGDSRTEIAASLRTIALVRVCDVDAAGALTTITDTPVGSLPTRLGVADFNGDERVDLVVSNGESNSISLLLGQPGGGFTTNEVAAGDGPTALLTEDLDRDGFADLLVSTLKGSDFRVLLGDGNGGVSQALVFPGTFTANTAVLMDVNGTGLPDLVIGAFEAKRLAVFKNVSQ